jgi:hypothetical protein
VALYSVVWEEDLDDGALDLEAIWTRFQRVDPFSGPWPPEGYEGRSLSIGDVIEIDGERWTPVSFGFEKVERVTSDLSLIPRPGESAEDVIERVSRAAVERRRPGLTLSEPADEPAVFRFSGRLPELPEDDPGVYGEGCVGCSLEDDGDGESGPNLVVYLSAACPVHGKLVAGEEVE